MVSLQMRREGMGVARCGRTSEGVLGREGARRGKTRRVIGAGPHGHRADDLGREGSNTLRVRRLHLRFDLIGLGARRARHRRIFAQDPWVEDCRNDLDTAGARCHRAHNLGPQPSRDHRPFGFIHHN